MVELQPLIQVMPPPLQSDAGGGYVWWVLAGAGALVLLWLIKRRLLLWWLRLTLRPARVQTHARRVLKYFPRLNTEQRRRLELIAFAPAAQPEQVGALRALLREVCP